MPPLRAQTTIAQLKSQFEHPPDESRPMMRWWWFGVAVEKPEIRRELEQMKADGIGGAELAFVYPQVVDDPAKDLVNEPFLSSAMLDNVSYAASEARRLGLRLDVTLGSGWPYGGPATTLKEAAGCLRVVELAVAPGATSLPGFAVGGRRICNFHFAGERRAKALAGDRPRSCWRRDKRKICRRARPLEPRLSLSPATPGSR